MARECMVLGSTPYEEDCAQVGSADYWPRAKYEGIAFINQLIRIHGEPPGNAYFAVKGFPHDFGTYHEVVICFNDNEEEEIEFAYKVEGDVPARWDAEAIRELSKIDKIIKNPKSKKGLAPYGAFRKDGSAYFQGRYRIYGPYQWSIKYYHWEGDDEIEAAQQAFFYDDFYDLKNELGRDVKIHIDGRSGGWLVVDEDLTEDEWSIVNSYVERVMKNLPKFLYEYRQEQREEKSKNPSKEKRVKVKPKDRKSVSAKIRKLIHEGYPQEQAVAIALNMYGKHKLGPRGGRKK